MPYIRCSVEREYVARLSTLVVVIQIAPGLFSHFRVCTILGWPHDAQLLFFSFQAGCAAATLSVILGQRVSPCFMVGITLRLLRSALLFVVCLTRQFLKGGLQTSTISR